MTTDMTENHSSTYKHQIQHRHEILKIFVQLILRV